VTRTFSLADAGAVALIVERSFGDAAVQESRWA
jgi:hypothetical protein